MGRIVDVDGKEIKCKIDDKKIEANNIDPYTQKTLQAIDTLREMLAKTTSDLDLTFFQVLNDFFRYFTPSIYIGLVRHGRNL